mgnify:CR=1 FL=1
MGFLDSINISASALTAERLRMDIISKNVANANTTRTANGTPYRRQVVVFQETEKDLPFSRFLTTELNKFKFNMNGVKAVAVIEDNPMHPDANEKGYVQMPNVDIMVEMVNMISATRAYEANVTSINSTKSMAMKALDIGRI